MAIGEVGDGHRKNFEKFDESFEQKHRNFVQRMVFFLGKNRVMFVHPNIILGQLF